ncbi:unnamed protein product [Penicillium olsonii]|nr:unnamed protein product [Penicillium olsonii]
MMADETNTTAPKPESTHLEAPTDVDKIKNGDKALALFDNLDDIHVGFEPGEEKRLVRKIDMMILPFLSVCYAFYYIDKTTLSYAAIFGIQEDLNLSGAEYSWLSSVFYFGFLAWSFPTNLLMQKFPIGKYLGVNIFGWGFFLMLQAAAKNFTQLAVLRVISGAAEACSDPAFMLITAMWYTRRQQPIRIGLWYTANGFGIALGGLLGYGIGQIEGALASWKYEFLIIGALCCAWGIVMIIFLPDSPVTAPQLSEHERRMAVERLRDNQTGIENRNMKPRQIFEALTDWKVWIFFLLGFSGNIPNGGISNFGTLIIKGFGYSTSNADLPVVTTLMQIPYGCFIAVMILAAVFINDSLPRNNRCAVAIFFVVPTLAGSLGLNFVPDSNSVARLICYYLTGSYNASFVIILSLVTSNISGHTKKSVTNAMIFLGVCTGNIAGPFFYKSSQAPQYTLGIWSMVVANLIEIGLIVLLAIGLALENKRRDSIQSTQEGVDDYTRQLELDRTAFSDLTDKENLNFRYVY